MFPNARAAVCRSLMPTSPRQVKQTIQPSGSRPEPAIAALTRIHTGSVLDRIPAAAWLLMAAIALCGYRLQKSAVTRKLSRVLPYLDCHASDRRYRCSAAWFDPHQSTESGEFGEVARALNFAARASERCSSGIKPAILRARRPFPVYAIKRTFSESDRSQTCPFAGHSKVLSASPGAMRESG